MTSMQQRRASFGSKAFFIWTCLLLVSFSPLSAAEESGKSFSFFDVWALPRVWLGAIVALIGLFLLMRSRVSRTMRLVSMVIVFFLFSIVAVLPLGKFAEGMGLHPSPMCTIEKALIFVQMGRAVPVVFLSILAFILLLTFIGNKLFCGWNCPIGAVQEILHRLPLPKIRLPFYITNTIRALVFALFVILLFTAGTSLYAWLNPFEFLHWSLEAAVIPAFLVTFVAGLFIYRPFCYLACPMGLASWLVEHLSLIRVRLDEKACTRCMRCVKESPCPSVQAILDGKFSRPDCHACGACIESCPEKALKFTSRFQ
jgi:polyferredoxin